MSFSKLELPHSKLRVARLCALVKSSVFCVAAVAGEVDWDTLGKMLCAHLLGEVKIPL